MTNNNIENHQNHSVLVENRVASLERRVQLLVWKVGIWTTFVTLAAFLCCMYFATSQPLMLPNGTDSSIKKSALHAKTIKSCTEFNTSPKAQLRWNIQFIQREKNTIVCQVIQFWTPHVSNDVQFPQRKPARTELEKALFKFGGGWNRRDIEGAWLNPMQNTEIREKGHVYELFVTDKCNSVDETDKLISQIKYLLTSPMKFNQSSTFLVTANMY